MAVQSTANRQTAEQIYSSQARQAARVAAQTRNVVQGGHVVTVNGLGQTTNVSSNDNRSVPAAVSNPQPMTGEQQQRYAAAAAQAREDAAQNLSTAPVTTAGEEPRKVTYVDSSGQKQTGVYTAAAEDAVTAPETAGAAGAASPTHWDTMRDYYRQMYEEAVAANNDANARAADRAREAVQAQIDALNQGYQGTNRQLYRDYMENQRTLPQQMAALGYTGGLSESSQLRLRNAYEEALAENERARLREESGANASLAQQLFDAQAATDAANRSANQQRLSYLAALQEQQYSQEQQELQNRAALLGSAGDFSGYAALGYSQKEIDNLQSVWARQNPGLAYSMGRIDAGTYYQLTGSYPPGYKAAVSYGGSGGSAARNPGGAKEKEAASLSEQITEAVSSDATYVEILNAIGAKASSGEITREEAQQLIRQAQIECIAAGK